MKGRLQLASPNTPNTPTPQKGKARAHNHTHISKEDLQKPGLPTLGNATHRNVGRSTPKRKVPGDGNLGTETVNSIR